VTHVFPIAPMSPVIRAFTVVLLALPTGFVVLALTWPRAFGLVWAAGFLAVIYLAVWLWWRPRRFEVAPDALRICFPAWTRTIDRACIESARILDGAGVRAELGFTLRIGAGGLWGGFGWLWTRRRGLVEFYISRLDDFVLLEGARGRPLLVTPSDPVAFAGALTAS